MISHHQVVIQAGNDVFAIIHYIFAIIDNVMVIIEHGQLQYYTVKWLTKYTLNRLASLEMNFDPSVIQAMQTLFHVFQQSGSTSASAPVAPLQPTSTEGSSSTSAPLPQVTSSYTTRRAPLAGLPPSARGHPNPMTTALPLASQYQPILGASSLAVNMDANSNQARRAGPSRSRSVDRPSRSEISHANTGRQRAIEAHFPDPLPLVARARTRPRTRTRGRAHATPAVPPAANSPLSVFDVDDQTNEQFINIAVHIYLPTPQPNGPIHLVYKLADSLVNFLKANDLHFTYRLPSTTSIVSLIDTITDDMAESPRKWQFQPLSLSLRQHIGRHEAQHLQLLALSNRGIPRRADSLIMLSRQRPSRDLTLGDLFNRANASKFCKPDITIRDRRLILTFAIARSGATCLAQCGPHATSRRRHACLAEMMHSIYSAGNETNETSPDWTSPQCYSGGETDEEMEVEDDLFGSDAENLPPTPTPAAPPSNQQQNTAVRSQSPTQNDAVVLAPVAPPSNQQQNTAVFEAPSPGQLWADQWTPQSGRHGTLFEANDFASALFQTASSTTARAEAEFTIQGTSVAELAVAFVHMVKIAVENQNFGPILAANRTFKIVRQNGTLVSTGRGVEREVIYMAFRFFTDNNGRWFLPRFDGRCSIATTMSLAAAPFVGADRRTSLGILGCLTSLMLIHGIAPEPLGPALIQWAANDCNLQSLTREFVSEWHPELKALLDSWNRAGPTGSIAAFQTHFATFHDTQIASIESRDLAQHNALARDILYTALIGPQPATHDELAAFLAGLRLPCLNGFTFTEVLRSFPGGSSTFLSRTWTSIIHDFESLRPHLTVSAPTRPVLAQFIAPDSPVLGMDLGAILQNFLQGSGAPCPGLLEEAMPCFSKAISFDQIDSAAFRSMILCWAATGSPHVEFEDHQQLTTYFVGPNDTGYDDDPTSRDVFMKKGVICFHLSCS
ncbi:hypothetical protein C8R45DRAFT_1113986 [Mycena sanguinolenta]|nr:hypothetical protein C8R45DRAFT_1113986 [Mycena sanguinolenta]